MWAVDADPLESWPRVRELKPGMYRVKGRYVHVVRWLILLRAMNVGTYLASLTLLAAAFLPALLEAPRYVDPAGTVSLMVEGLTDLRFAVRNLLTETLPGAGRAIYYTGTNPIDWHLLALAVLLYGLRRNLAWLLTWAAMVAAWPLLATRFRLTFTPEHVVIHRWIRSLRIPRAMGLDGGVSFRTVPHSQQSGCLGAALRMRPLVHGLKKQGFPGEEPPPEFSTVTAMQGLRSHRVATPRSALDAYRIVESCHEAMNRSRTM